MRGTTSRRPMTAVSSSGNRLSSPAPSSQHRRRPTIRRASPASAFSPAINSAPSWSPEGSPQTSMSVSGFAREVDIVMRDKRRTRTPSRRCPLRSAASTTPRRLMTSERPASMAIPAKPAAATLRTVATPMTGRSVLRSCAGLSALTSTPRRFAGVPRMASRQARHARDHRIRAFGRLDGKTKPSQTAAACPISSAPSGARL